MVLICWLRDASSWLRSGRLARDQIFPDQIFLQDKNSRVGNENVVSIS